MRLSRGRPDAPAIQSLPDPLSPDTAVLPTTKPTNTPQGKIKGYFPQTGRFTLQYDDGQCEAVLLERERFVWHSPRGVTAGFKPALHALMHALGAEGVKAVPLAQQQQQEAGAPEGSRLPAPLTPAPEV
jgi:hypothetical protein